MTHLKSVFWTIIILAIILGGGYIYVRSFDPGLATTLFPNVAECEKDGQQEILLQASMEDLIEKIETLEEKVDSTKGYVEGYVSATKATISDDTPETTVSSTQDEEDTDGNEEKDGEQEDNSSDDENNDEVVSTGTNTSSDTGATQ